MENDAMKRFSLIGLMLVCLSHSVFADPTTYLEFKQLSAKDQDHVVSDVNNPTHGKLLRWWWRLHMGEDAWHHKEQERLIDQHGYTALETFFLNYQHLREQFLRQEWTEKKTGMSASELATEGTRFDEMEQSGKDTYSQAIDLLSSINPTEKLQVLSKEANELSIKWYNEFLSEGRKITADNMADIDREKNRIVAELDKSPKLVPKEVESAIDALPEDYPQVHGLPVPRK